MEQIAPQGSVYQAGTLSGNPLAMTAGIATLKELKKPNFYDSLEEKSACISNEVLRISQKVDIPLSVNRVGSVMSFFFTDRTVNNFEDAKTAYIDRFTVFYNQMLQKGFFLPPSQFEAMFVSAAHETKEIELFLAAVEDIFAAMQ